MTMSESVDKGVFFRIESIRLLQGTHSFVADIEDGMTLFFALTSRTTLQINDRTPPFYKSGVLLAMSGVRVAVDMGGGMLLEIRLHTEDVDVFARRLSPEAHAALQPVLEVLRSATSYFLLQRTNDLSATLMEVYLEYQNMLPGSECICDLLLRVVLTQMYYAHERGEHSIPVRYASRLLEYLHENFAQRLSVDKVARRMRISVPYLQKLFRTRYGITVRDYVNRLRIRCALELLADPSAQTIDVMIQCGFESRQHFASVFKAHTGDTPTAYMQAVHMAENPEMYVRQSIARLPEFPEIDTSKRCLQ